MSDYTDVTDCPICPMLATDRDDALADARAFADEVDRLRTHVRSLHRLNGWSKQRGWWCSCGSVIVPRSYERDTTEPRPWSPEGRTFAAAVHAQHVDELVGA